MNNKLIMKYPSSWYGEMWREALFVGNGKIGGLVYGGVHHEIITVNHTDLWWNYDNSQKLPNVYDAIPKMRKLIDEKKYNDAQWVLADALKEKGYKESDPGTPLSVCDIDIVTHMKSPFKNYRRTLDMESGEAEVSWYEENEFYKRDFFISRANDTVFCKITSSDLYCGEFSLKVHELQTIGNLTPPKNQTTIFENEFISYGAQKDDGTYFGAVMKIKHNGKSEIKDGKININAQCIELVLKTFVNEKEPQFSKLKKELSYDFSYDAELKKHKKIHSAIFNATEFSINDSSENHSNEELLLDAYSGEASDELIEKMWKYGRYLLISASRKGENPCDLYGLWSGHYNTPWVWNMFNVNIEMIYWQALSGNMPELLLCVFDYIDKQTDDYRENAKKLFNCRGINICSVTTPVTGLHKLLYPHILNWIGGAGWIAQHYYDYYLCTRDEKFLKNRALPFMYEAMLFYEDYLFEDENGFYVISPSESPENAPSNLVKEANNPYMQVVKNSTMDFAILKELLTNIIEGCELTGMYSEKLDAWKNMLKKIPPYMINEDGAVSEWMSPDLKDNYEHRHESHLYPVFPGTEVTRTGSAKLYKAFEKAVEKRKAFGLKDQSGWSLTFMANVYARMGKGDDAINVLDMLLRSNVMNNLTTVHNDWRRMGIATCGEQESPVQIDANMGFTSAINEMLVFSTRKAIYLFNALPQKWKSGKAGAFLTRTGTLVTLSWNTKKAEVQFVQKAACMEFEAILPVDFAFEDGRSKIKVNLSKNEKIKFTLRRK